MYKDPAGEQHHVLLRTERLILREFAEADWAATLAYQRAPAYQRLYPDAVRTEAESRAFIARFLRWQAEEPRSKYQLAVALPGQDSLIGNCGIRRPAPNTPEGEFGCEFAPQHWARGYATEVGRALLEFGFEQLGLHRVWARCLAENAAALRLAERLGMRQEGRLREQAWVGDHWCDTLLYGILAAEWAA